MVVFDPLPLLGVENEDCLAHPAGDEAGEQGDVSIGDVIVPNPAVPAVTDVVFRQQILFVQVPLRAVG